MRNLFYIMFIVVFTFNVSCDNEENSIDDQKDTLSTKTGDQSDDQLGDQNNGDQSGKDQNNGNQGSGNQNGNGQDSGGDQNNDNGKTDSTDNSTIRF